MENIENMENSERYVRKDVEGGFIYNKSEISYYKQAQKIDVISNLMLGDYNTKGSYVLDKDLVQQLVKVAKIYQYSFGANMFCQTAFEIEEYGKIDFAIKIKNDFPKKGKATAVLQLLEPIDKANGYYTNTNVVELDYFTENDSPSFVVNTLKYFNVVSKKESGLISKEKVEDIDLIVARKRYEELRKNILSGKFEEIYQTMFNKKVKLLSKSVVGKKIMDQFAKDSYNLNGWFVKEGMKGYHRTMYELLTSIIEQHSEEILQDVKLSASLNKLDGEYAKAINNAILLSENTIIASPTLRENIELAEIVKQENAKQKQNESASKPVFVDKKPEEKKSEQKQESKKQEVKENSQNVEAKPAKPAPKAKKQSQKSEQQKELEAGIDDFVDSLNEDLTRREEMSAGEEITM